MKSTLKNLVFSLGMFALVTSVNSCGRAVAPVATQFHSLPQHTMVRSQSVAPAAQVLVQFTPSAGRQALQNFNQKYGLRTVDYIPGINTYVMGVNAFASTQELHLMVSNMSREAVVQNVELNGEIGLLRR